MIADGPIVGLRLQSRPQTLSIVRGMLSGLAERLRMDPELIDDLKTSVSEACNNVVLHAYGGEPGPMEVRLFVDGDRVRATVSDRGVGLPAVAPGPEAAPGIGVSVIRALALEARFESRAGGGTDVVMDFAGRRDGRGLFTAPGAVAAEDPSGSAADGGRAIASCEGEVAVTLSPVALLDSVLGRLARALAATAHFSLDRFSDVYLITDTLAAHTARAAAGSRVDARLLAGDRRLQISLGPLRAGTGAPLTTRASRGVDSPLALLADAVWVVPDGDDELLWVEVVDRRP